jgi:hypothetical protein
MAFLAGFSHFLLVFLHFRAVLLHFLLVSRIFCTQQQCYPQKRGNYSGKDQQNQYHLRAKFICTIPTPIIPPDLFPPIIIIKYLWRFRKNDDRP